MSATVVVPTRDRPAALRRCLAGVRTQENVTLELVVVDDGSADEARVAGIAEDAGGRLVRLGGTGPAAARNAGVAVAQTDRILLLDDDCVPHAGWASALIARSVADSRRVVAGTVVLPRAPSAWLRASEQIARNAEIGSGFFRTLNLSCSRELLREVPFDAAFPTAGGEDRDWCLRAARVGVTFTREPAAVVEHRASLGARSFFEQQLRYGRAVHGLRRRGTHVAVAGSVQWRGLASGFQDGIPVGLAMASAPLVTAVGFAQGAWSDRSR